MVPGCRRHRQGLFTHLRCSFLAIPEPQGWQESADHFDVCMSDAIRGGAVSAFLEICAAYGKKKNQFALRIE